MVMNMENMIIDYRREIQIIDTESIADIKNDMDIYSKGLKKLFWGLNVDYYVLKENRRKNGNWNFPDSKKDAVYKLFTQIRQKDSTINLIICGKASTCDVYALLDVVELILDLFRENGESDDILENKRETMYRALELPLLEVKRELRNLEMVIDKTYDNEEDEFTLDLHMMYQRYISDRIRQVKVEAAMLYVAINEEISATKFRNEAPVIVEELNLESLNQKMDDANAILRDEYPKVNIFDKEMMSHYNERASELLGLTDNEQYSKFKRYLIQKTKIQRLCEESKEYCEIVSRINSAIQKKTGDQTKVNNYLKLENERQKIVAEIISSMGEEIIENPIPYSNAKIDYNGIFGTNKDAISQMCDHEDEEKIKDTMLYWSAEEFFGPL